jgi:tetratricopeptide (TPR) repeat protein
MIKKNLWLYLFFLILLLSFSNFISCAGTAASAQEYYSIGMAYFELGKFDEAEKWLNRAKQTDRTMVASTYNLGRLAYEKQRYDDAVKYFESILKKDADNILALKAAAYSRIKTGDIEIAEKHYSRLLSLVPDSADDGYNHALVLFALGRYTDSEELLEKYPAALQENKDTMLLYARSQAKLKKVEAIESFSNWLSVNTDVKVRYEYGQVLEDNEFYARALEEYRKAYTDIPAAAVNPAKHEIRFAIAKVLLIADGENIEGVNELQGAVESGYNDIAAVESLLDYKISAANKNTIQNIINNMIKTAAEQEQIQEQTPEQTDETKADDSFPE